MSRVKSVCKRFDNDRACKGEWDCEIVKVVEQVGRVGVDKGWGKAEEEKEREVGVWHDA